MTTKSEILKQASENNNFKNELLTSQEKNLLISLQSQNFSEAVINSYSEYVPGVISKYYTWLSYVETNKEKLLTDIDDLSSKVKLLENDTKSLSELSKLVSGATTLFSYSKDFAEQSNTHNKNAESEIKKYYLSLSVLGFIIFLVFFFTIEDYSVVRNMIAEDIRSKYDLGIQLFKIILLIFGFQVSQFFRKNYSAEKHLQQVYLHRSKVLQSLHAVYNSIDNKEEKDKILSAGAMFAYDRGESGYITTKEGAGSSESMFEGILKSISK